MDRSSDTIPPVRWSLTLNSCRTATRRLGERQVKKCARAVSWAKVFFRINVL